MKLRLLTPSLVALWAISLAPDEAAAMKCSASGGLLNEFERPNDGEIVGGDLRLHSPSPWSGSLRAGMRAQLSDSLLVEASLGYLSIGQSGLDTFEAGLYLSYGF